MGFLDLFFPGRVKFGVAANIIAAEYTLQNAPPELVKKAFADVFCYLAKTQNLDSPEAARKQFLSKPRNVQLNLLALAFHRIGISPMLKTEFWTEVDNPLKRLLYSTPHLEIVRKRINKKNHYMYDMNKLPITAAELEKILSPADC